MSLPEKGVMSDLLLRLAPSLIMAAVAFCVWLTVMIYDLRSNQNLNTYKLDILQIEQVRMSNRIDALVEQEGAKKADWSH